MYVRFPGAIVSYLSLDRSRQQHVAEYLPEYFCHLGLLREGAVVLDAENQRVGARNERVVPNNRNRFQFFSYIPVRMGFSTVLAAS